MKEQKHITSLKGFIKTLDATDKESFASDCGTTFGYLKLIMYGVRRCDAALAINIDRESNGAVTCDELCPDVDFNYLRNQRLETILSN